MAAAVAVHWRNRRNAVKATAWLDHNHKEGTGKAGGEGRREKASAASRVKDTLVQAWPMLMLAP